VLGIAGLILRVLAIVLRYGGLIIMGRLIRLLVMIYRMCIKIFRKLETTLSMV
jgi:hypothetical protein